MEWVLRRERRVGLKGGAHRYVAMCDVLGFASLIRDPSMTLEQLATLYQKLLDDAAGLLKYDVFSIYSDKPPRHEAKCIEHVVFSDTLLLWADALPNPPDPDEFTRVSMFFECLGALIATSLQTRMPLRIGVAYGECYIDRERDVYLGAPIVDAYETEKAQEWIGGACHVTCETAPHFATIVALGHVVEYKIPLKPSSEVTRLDKAIDWRANLDAQHIAAMLGRKIDELHRGPTVKQTVKQKWDNTRVFLESLSSAID